MGTTPRRVFFSGLRRLSKFCFVPYTTLFRSPPGHAARGPAARRLPRRLLQRSDLLARATGGGRAHAPARKSTRLNSSHVGTSYTVFCAKRKKGREGCGG